MMISTELSRQGRNRNFSVRAEPTLEPVFAGEKTIYLTYDGRQENASRLAPHEARKLSELLIAEFDLGSQPEEFAMFLEVLRSVFSLAYVQGRFDAENGFNTCTAVASVTKAWLEENDDLLSLPLDIAALLRRLRDEVQKMSGE